VVFRLVGVEEQERWVPPTYYGNAWGYWGYAAPMVYEPGYLTTDRIVQVESAAYAVSNARLVWAARSDTLNPSNAKQLVGEVVRAVVERMRDDCCR
jgi:malate synthase